MSLPPLDFETLTEAVAGLNRTIAECDAASTLRQCDDLHVRICDILKGRNTRLEEHDLRLILMALSGIRVLMHAGSGGCSLGLVDHPAAGSN